MKKTTTLLALFALILFLTFSITGCNKKVEKTSESTNTMPVFDLMSAKTEIEAANQEFASFIANGDSIGLANLYSQNAKLMVDGGPSVLGRENIQSAFSGFINSGITRIDLKTVDVWGTENLITEEGEFILFAEEKEVDQGKYLVLWKKEDGKWHLFRDIFNSNLPTEK